MRSSYGELLGELQERQRPTYQEEERLDQFQITTNIGTAHSAAAWELDGKRDGPRPDAAKQAAQDKKSRGPQVFNGYVIRKASPEFCFWSVTCEDGSPVCEELAGWFSSQDEAKKAILTHGTSSKAKPDTK